MVTIIKFIRNTEGAISVEYVMLGAFVSILIIGGVTSIGSRIAVDFIGPVAQALNPTVTAARPASR